MHHAWCHMRLCHLMMKQLGTVHQVGVIHTSYRELSKRNAGLVMAGVSSLLNSWLCAIHCHKVRLP